MKKKIMANLLVVAMSLSLAACEGSNDAETKDNTESSAEAETPTEENKEVTAEGFSRGGLF